MSNNQSSGILQNSSLSDILLLNSSREGIRSRDPTSNEGIPQQKSFGKIESPTFSHVIANHTNTLLSQEEGNPVLVANAPAIDPKPGFRDDLRHITNKTTTQRKPKRQADSKN